MKKVFRSITWLFLLVIVVQTISAQVVVGQQSEMQLEYSALPEKIQDLDVHFVADLSYDDHERAQFDLILPKSSEPMGLLLYIHGGGFINGDKDRVLSDYNLDNIRSLIQQGVAVASINYSFLDPAGEDVGVIKCLLDAKRALQYIRSNAAAYNIDKDRIVLSGASAGAGASLWVAMQDDMKGPDSSDPVLRESTRVSGIAIYQTQCSYDIEDRWINDVFPEYNVPWSVVSAVNAAVITRFYGVSTMEEYNTDEIKQYRDRVDMMDFLSADDPEFWAENVLTAVAPPIVPDVIQHHAYHVRALKEQADKVGLSHVCYYGKDPILYEDPSGEDYVDFVLRKLGVRKSLK